MSNEVERSYSDKFDWGNLTKTRYRERKEARRPGIKTVARYWEEFADDYIPHETPGLVVNLIKLAFFWGALMTVFHRRDLLATLPKDKLATGWDNYKLDVDRAIAKLHEQRKKLKG